ncbi:MAG TPA: hypothetical protein PKC65_00165 [Pyrinomonadaceae bacterium]|nr:hypothetical protein [Pyrinomonadaceae bacterium]
MKADILRTAAEFYLKSGDFNGISALDLSSSLGVEWDDLRADLADLIQEDKIGVLHSDQDMNTHILRVGFPDASVQIEKLDTDDLFHTCVYPRPIYLETVVDTKHYENEPYKLDLANGEPQLAFRTFDLSVLEYYRNDPRYYYHTNDINGSISVKREYYESNQMPEHDQILLQTFGFAYDDDLNRGVAVFLRYLSDLSPEHQQIWKMKEVNGTYDLHPEYYRNTVLGAWGKHLPICSAFILELYVVNQMCAAMGRPPLFLTDYGPYGEDRPQNFTFLVRPTLEEFNNFVLLLDKLLSDNINKKFFQNEVSYETETPRYDGKVVVSKKGTIQILEDWISKVFRPQDRTLIDTSIASLRKIRKLRQQPAHAIKENVFNQTYFKEQRALIIEAYEAVRMIRLLLANHPLVRKAAIEVPDALANGDVATL